MIIYVIFFAISLLCAEGIAQTPVVKVCSTYFDHSYHKKSKICGYGFILTAKKPLLNDDSDFFIVTDAHLSHGENPTAYLQLESSNLELNKFDRLSDNISDVEIFRIPKNAVPYHNMNSATPVAKDGKKSIVFNTYDNLKENSLQTGLTTFIPLLDFKLKKTEYAWTPKSHIFGSYSSNRQFNIPITVSETDFVSDTSSERGMSGLPVIESMPMQPGAYSIIGLVKSIFLGQTKTMITPTEDIIRLYDRLFKGEKEIPNTSENLDGFTWKMSKGITYRVFKQNLLELDSDSIPEGGGDGPDAGDESDNDAANSSTMKSHSNIFQPRLIFNKNGKPISAFAIQQNGPENNGVAYAANFSTIRYLAKSNRLNFDQLMPISDRKQIYYFLEEKWNHLLTAHQYGYSAIFNPWCSLTKRSDGNFVLTLTDVLTKELEIDSDISIKINFKGINEINAINDSKIIYPDLLAIYHSNQSSEILINVQGLWGFDPSITGDPSKIYDKDKLQRLPYIIISSGQGSLKASPIICEPRSE